MIKAFFDGSCQPENPGGVIGMGGYVVTDDGEELWRFSRAKEQKSTNTNNVAEYMACSNVLWWLYQNNYTSEEIIIYGDSKMVVNQLNGKWNIGNGHYSKVAKKAKSYLEYFSNITFCHIFRHDNELADQLSRESVGPYLRNYVSKKPKPIRSKSNKQQGIERKYTEVLAVKAEEASFCPGCGNAGGMLSPSHTLSRYFYPQYINDPDNIIYLDSACHTRVEEGRWLELVNFDQVYDYAKSKDSKYAERMLKKGAVRMLFGRYQSRLKSNLNPILDDLIMTYEKYPFDSLEEMQDEGYVNFCKLSGHWEKTF